jgi:hypothetical protein
MSRVKQTTQLHSRLLDLILGGNRYLWGDLHDLGRTQMYYWIKRAHLIAHGLQKYEVTDASIEWAKAERAELERVGAERVAKHEARKLKAREYAKRYYHAHKEHCKAVNRAWAEKNREHVREYNRRWKALHPESFLTRKMRRIRAAREVA